MREAIRTLPELCYALSLDIHSLPAAIRDFPLLVPRPFVALMEQGNPDDPLLRQILPVPQEDDVHPDYLTDPLAERQSNPQQGIIHKYRGRVLLLAASGCAVNCRYCFRRHFPYSDNRVNQKQWQSTLNYVSSDNSIHEVILSGGDPLLLNDKILSELIQHIEQIPHVRRLRIHTRLPVVIPQRITTRLVNMLRDSRLLVSCVLHINHASELSPALKAGLSRLRQASVTLLNQSVLLNGVNHHVDTLVQLSEELYAAGILPYYLHLLDKVQGANHFSLTDKQATRLYRQLMERLPGYLLPKLVREESGQNSKTLVTP